MIDIRKSTIDELATLLSSGEVSALELVNSCIQIIQSEDKYYNAVAFLNPDAEKIAVELDNERKIGLVRGPLHGVPILIKDNIDTADNLQKVHRGLPVDSQRTQRGFTTDSQRTDS